MSAIINWVKTHKLLTFNILVVAFILFNILGVSTKHVSYDTQAINSRTALMTESMVATGGGYREAAPQMDVEERKVVENSNYSLLVKNVVESLDQIKTKTTELSGYTVSSDLRKQEYGESADIQVRIPTDKVDEMTKFLRSTSVKVVSESISGNDVTDQYMDVERRIADLEKSRAKMELIMNSADTVNEMLEVQRGIFQIQDQIDSYKGRLLYMDGTTKSSRLTIYISTDELSLPYTPTKTWRPEVVAKTAIRSLLTNLIKLGNLMIWAAVYLPLIIIAVIIFKLVRKALRKSVK